MAELETFSKTYTQKGDCCGSELEDPQRLRVEQLDGGGGPYFVLSTDRWAFESISEVVELLKAAGVPEAPVPQGSKS